MKNKKFLLTLLTIFLIACAQVDQVNEDLSNSDLIHELAQEDSESRSTFIDVPFTSQAPYAEWDDHRQQDGCEEATALMAVEWAKGHTSISKDFAKQNIISSSEYQNKTYGSSKDTDTEDLVKRILNEYYHFENAEVVNNITSEQIIQSLIDGNPIILPVNGQKLNNPNFTGAGPDKHSIIVIGYDDSANEFITNDPGTRNGKYYRYPIGIIEQAIYNYPTTGEEQNEYKNSAIIVHK